MEQSCNNHEVSVVDTPAAAVAAPAKKSKKPLVITLIIVGAVLTLVVEILAGIMLVPVAMEYLESFTSGCTAPVDKYFEVMYDGKAENVEDLAPEESWERKIAGSEQTREVVMKAARRWAENTHKALVKNYGENFDYSYTVTEKTALTEEELEKTAKSLAEGYGFDPATIKKGYTLRVDVVISDREPAQMEFIVVQIGKEWYRIAWLKLLSVHGGFEERAYFPIELHYSFLDQ